MSEGDLAAAVDDADRITRPLDDNYFDLLGERYSHLRQFAPALLDALTLRGSAPDDDLLDAIDLLRGLNQSGRRRVADSAPTNFVPARWQSYVIDADGRIDRRYYELCALCELRAALRAGDVWVDGSRRYADPETYLIPHEQWPARRAEACRLTGTPLRMEPSACASDRPNLRRSWLDSMAASLRTNTSGSGATT